jgi:hypothetical protein
MRSAQPPFEYLITSSEAALESFHLARLNQAANFRKELRQVMGDWIEAEAEARLARWILDCRRAQSPDTSQAASPFTEPAISGTLENDIFPPADALSFVSRSSPPLQPPSGNPESQAETIAFWTPVPHQNRPPRGKKDVQLLATPLFPEVASDAARLGKKSKAATNARAPQSNAATAPLFPETAFETLRSESGNRDLRAAPHPFGSVRDPSTFQTQSIILRKDAPSFGIAGLHRSLRTAGPIRAPFQQLSLYRRGRRNTR